MVSAGFRFGFALAGLLAAGLTWLAFDFGLFSGSRWSGATLAVLIGIASAGVMLALDRAVSRPATQDPKRPVKLKGPWACPLCGAAYRPEATTCSDCHVPLVHNSQG